MSYYSMPGQLAGAWRQLADTAIEYGETPLFALGLDSLHRTGLLNLLALSRLSRQNLGPQHPTVVAGGDGWLWLLAMLVWRPVAGGYRRHPAASSSETTEGKTEGPLESFDDTGRTVLYAGADSALYAAALNLAGQQGDPGATPSGLGLSGPSTASAGVEGADFELLPALFEREPVPEAAEPSEDAWLQRGERWASGLLAFALLVFAFFG
ncbi:MAG: hypothetical protein OXG26_14935 [Caldilineaceae bacterium]|nr:hypothetical protein [Caldilineaceae bacterium]